MNIDNLFSLMNSIDDGIYFRDNYFDIIQILL